MKCKTLQKYMSANPQFVSQATTLQSALQLMVEHHIRHLPVMDGGKVSGIISDRDVKLALSFKDVDPSRTLVSDVAKDEVYTASPSARLEEVVGHMADRRIGSAVVVDNGKLVGMFTAVDAMVALADLLSERAHVGGCCGH